jgi:cytochrome c-type biogenesis protein CcmH
MTPSRRTLLIAAAALVLIAAVWSFVYLASPRPPTLDQRVADVASRLRCPICQGESVQDSPSALAQQMRAIIRQQLQEGRSEQQVIQYFVDRYGEQIVWEPPMQGFSLLAWTVPFLLLLAGVVVIFFVLREWQGARPRTGEQTSLEETARAADEARVHDSDEELALYRAELEAELAASDPLFRPPRTQMEAR